MTDPILQIPLDQIDEAALPRDRGELDPTALDELMLSILSEGLRQPIEVWELSTPHPPYRYGLISGFRRLAALRRTGRPDATIAAFQRQPATIAAAMASMISENEMHEALSPWEKGRILIDAVSEGLFETVDAAVKGLHPNADPSRQSRLRTLASVVETFSTLIAPEELSQRQLLRLAGAIRADFVPLIQTALLEQAPKNAAAQWALLDPILTEAEAWLKNPDPLPRPGRPKRFSRPRDGLCIRRELTPRGWSLHFTGSDATGMLMESLMDDIERWVGR